MKEDNLKLGNHYRLANADGGEACIVYYYYNPDADTNGFGFNIADGGGYLEISDVNSDSVISSINMTFTEME